MAKDQDLIHSTWLDSNRMLPKRFIRPVLEYTRVEAAGGIVLLVAAAIAVVWANSPWYESYFDLFNHHLSLDLGFVHIDESVKHLINDGLMAVFFFVVGLEIKRELVIGELNSVKKAALPAMAALGGMIVPAGIYVAIVLVGGADEAVHGWGIPMATDIAFSVGIVALLGSRVSVGAKLFLLALAIVDDIGAIIVIAVFYTDDLNWWYLLGGVAGLIGIYVARRAGIWSLLFYVPVALVVWELFLESGVHATIAGVTLGLLTPVRPKYSDEEFREKAVAVLDRWDSNRASPDAETRLDNDALELAAVAKASVSPLERLEHALHPWSSFVVVPLFALANAGVRFVGNDETLLEPWVQWEQAMLYKQYDAMARGDWAPTARQFYTGNASLPRTLFVDSGGFDESFRRAEDVELAYRLHDAGVSFEFEFAARAFHHAHRSYQAWLSIASAYGVNDVVFWRDHGQTWLVPTIRREYEDRHPLTRAYARLGLTIPVLARQGARLAPRTAKAAERLHLRALSRQILSAVYNHAYYDGLVSELGTVEDFLAVEPSTEAQAT